MPTAEDVDDRPTCECHGEPMARSGIKRGVQQWRCGVRNRERYRERYADPAFAARKRAEVTAYYRTVDKARRRKRYEERRARGVCVTCSGPLLSECLCWECLNRMEERRAVGN